MHNLTIFGSSWKPLVRNAVSVCGAVKNGNLKYTHCIFANLGRNQSPGVNACPQGITCFDHASKMATFAYICCRQRNFLHRLLAALKFIWFQRRKLRQDYGSLHVWERCDTLSPRSLYWLFNRVGRSYTSKDNVSLGWRNSTCSRALW